MKAFIKVDKPAIPEARADESLLFKVLPQVVDA
jgi:hypothetical protein